MQRSKLKTALLVALLAILIAPLAGCHYTDGHHYSRDYYSNYDRDPAYYRRYRDRGYYHYHPGSYHYHGRGY